MEWAGLAGWAVVVVAALAWGTHVVADAGVSLRAAPFSGRWAWRPGAGLVPAVIVGGTVAALGPRAAARLRWRAVPPLAAAAAIAWTVVLAASDGWARLTEPLTTRHEYEPFAAGIDDIGAFVDGFTRDFAGFPIHVQGHPPGPVVLAWILDRAGLGGAGWLAALAILAWGVAVMAALGTARAVAGEAAARRAAPVLAVLPAAVWAGTSLDALFAGLTATGCCLAVVALLRSSPTRAAGGGAVLGVALLCTYGTVAVLIVPAVVGVGLATARRRWANDDTVTRRRWANDDTVTRRRWANDDTAVRRRDAGGSVGAIAPGPLRLVPWAASGMLGALAVLAAAAVAGFWWVDGLDVTRRAYWDGVGGTRPGWYLTLVGNPGVLALAIGPAVAVGLATTLARARSGAGAAWRAALLPGAALVAVVAADLSQMSRGEVERIWLPFVPWLALAAPGHRRIWVVAQVAVALTLQSALDSPW